MARVCLLRAFFVPDDVRVRREINALADAGHQVTVICMRPPGSARREWYGSVEIHRLPMTHRRGGILRYAFEYVAFPLLAMLYLLGMTTQSVVGTSLFQILFVTMATTMLHAMTTKAVDLVLAMLLLIGSVTGAQIGTRVSMKVRPEYLRILLAIIVLLVAARMALGLGFRPDEVYSIEYL